MLYEATYTIQYTDDDGEVSRLLSEGDLTEAISYFHSPLPPRQRSSIGSFDSWQQRKITMYLDVVVDEDDGLSLSDLASESGHAASLASWRSSGVVSNGPGWAHLQAVPPPLEAIKEARTSSNTNSNANSDPADDAEYRQDRQRILARADALETFARIIREHVELDDRDWVRAMAFTHIGEDAMDFVAATQSVADSSSSRMS